MLSEHVLPCLLYWKLLSRTTSTEFSTWASTQSLQSTVRGPRGRIFSTDLGLKNLGFGDSGLGFRILGLVIRV